MCSGPAILLELCEIPLKDWLRRISDVTAQDLEDMFSFVFDIARGVEYLHSKKASFTFSLEDYKAFA
jgi:predicted Zn-dependent peptidase